MKPHRNFGFYSFKTGLSGIVIAFKISTGNDYEQSETKNAEKISSKTSRPNFGYHKTRMVSLAGFTFTE